MEDERTDKTPEEGETVCFYDNFMSGYRMDATDLGDGSYRIVIEDMAGTRQTSEDTVSTHGEFPVRILLPDPDGSPVFEYTSIDWTPEGGFMVLEDGWIEEEKPKPTEKGEE